MRIGQGYDSHRFIEGRKLIIGGVEIPHDMGLQGHSDADVLCHAIIDALIGAMGAGDIGHHFPDSDAAWKNASSIDMLSVIVKLMTQNGFRITWIDSTIITEKPKIAPFIHAIKESISRAGIPADVINIKAKTNEKMGFIGKGEGMAALAVCLLESL